MQGVSTMVGTNAAISLLAVPLSVPPFVTPSVLLSGDDDGIGGDDGGG